MCSTNLAVAILIALFCQLCVDATTNGHVKVTLALKQKSLSLLADMTLKMSDPDSPMYGKHLSREEIRKIVGITSQEFSSLRDWLKSLGATGTTLLPTGDVVTTNLPQDIAKLIMSDVNKGTNFLSTQEYLPKSIIHQVITKQQPKQTTNQYHSPRKTFVRKPTDLEADPNMQKQQVYKMDINSKGTNPRNLQMVWGPGTFGVSKDDLDQFYSTFNLAQPSVNDVYITQYKGTPNGDNWGEGTLDTTYITSFAPGITTLVVNSNTSSSTEEGNGFGYAFLDELLALSQLNPPPEQSSNGVPPLTSLPWVLSLSLGSLSWDSCYYMCQLLSQQGVYSVQQCNDYMQTQRQVCMYDSGDQADRMNYELMKLAARGVTILAATGDGGSHWSFEPFPSDGGIGDALNAICCNYNFPTFPAASPWVTGVGGIDLLNNPAKPVAWEGSGSGFSWRFPMPQYQANTVQNYLAQYNTTQNFPSPMYYNASNRAYPDVSAVANNVPLVISGGVTVSGGTSASTPTFAGIISMINDARLNAGKSPLGFLNPAIYKLAQQYPGELFQDITEGNSQTTCTQGFPATPGWDPVTGWGSPLFPGMMKYLGSL